MSRPPLPPPRALIIAAFAAVYVIWGSTYLFIRIAVDALPPFLMAGVRYGTAGAVLYGLARARGAPTGTRREWRAATVVGGLLLVGGNGLLSWAEQYVPTGLASLLIATVPLWMMLERWGLEGVRPDGLSLLGLVFGFVGLAFLVLPTLTGAGAAHGLGVAVVLLGAVSWATGSVLSRRLPLPADALLATGMEMLSGGVLQVAVGLLAGEAVRLQASSFTPAAVGAVLYLIVFGSLIGFTAYVWLLGVASPAAVSTYAFVNPVVAMLLGAVFLHETITARMLVASAVTLVGVGCITVSSSSRLDRTVRQTVEVAE